MSTVRIEQHPGPLKIRTPSSDSNGRPKPCLKSLPIPECSPLPFSSYPLHSPHVHFPPTPTLTSTNFTHSALQYDRAPIVVAENVCALPERGGRCYNTQSKNKRSSKRESDNCHSGSNVGIGGVEAGPSSSSRVLGSTEPITSYFHPRAYEAWEPERCLKEQHNPYFPYSSSSDSSSSSSSSESESDSDYSYGSLSPGSPPSIPRAAMNALTLGGAPSSAYPLDSSFFGPQQSRPQLSHSSFSRPSYQQSQQLSHNVHYQQPSISGLAECKPRKSAMSGGKKVKGSGSRSSSTSAGKIAKFGGGFSDQSMVLEGCLGGF